MTGYEPRFDLDLAEGAAAEGAIADLLAGRTKVEVKLDRHDNDRVYVETSQQPRRQQWKPSGLNVTTADLWAFVKAPTGVIVLVPTELLRAALRRGIGRECGETDGDNPTRGTVLRLGQLLDPYWW